MNREHILHPRILHHFVISIWQCLSKYWFKVTIDHLPTHTVWVMFVSILHYKKDNLVFVNEIGRTADQQKEYTIFIDIWPYTKCITSSL